jgi:beta-xylosidase
MKKIRIPVAAALLLAASLAGAAGLPNGGLWLDQNGNHINAHGGGMLHHAGRYYWFGEHKVAGKLGNTAQVGVRVYSSEDLAAWRDEGVALAVSADPASEIHRGCIIERPKVIYNETTGKFVMWFHLELVGREYQAAHSGVAEADRVTGPYTYRGSVRPNAGHWPRNVRAEQRDPVAIREAQAVTGLGGGPSFRTMQLNILGRDFEGGQQARDMTLFKDDDGAAYHVYSSEHNSTLHIARLTDDYLAHSGDYVRAFEHRWMEAPALFKHGGRYYLIASGCTGWAPNAARSAWAENIMGPWIELDNPCRGINPADGSGPEKTFGGQSTFVFPVAGQGGRFVAMFDLWRPDDAIDGRYVWLPVTFEDRSPRIVWRDTWDVSALVGPPPAPAP